MQEKQNDAFITPTNFPKPQQGEYTCVCMRFSTQILSQVGYLAFWSQSKEMEILYHVIFSEPSQKDSH